MKLTFVLFDEIEKASDALWNLLLRILDKATQTLGDNRKVDFSNALIFMTSNIGASEMSSLVSSKLGFHVSMPDDSNCSLALTTRLSRTGIEAARRKFTPEFLNRLDKIVVFRALGNDELNKIIDIELERVQQRVQTASAGTDTLLGHPVYVMTIVPKTPNKYLMRGRIWVDAYEYAIVRIEGRPAKSPSFWIKSVQFVHNYEKSGSFWLPVSDRSETEARIFGSTEVTIEYFDYNLDIPSLSATAEPVRK
jgi:hypothetical protein